MIAIKTIKFDLPIGGVSVKNLEEFREHFSLGVITLYQEGRLLKWLQLRKATQEITQLEALALHDPACPLTQAQAIGEALGVTDIGQKIILNSGSEHDGKKHELLWSFAFSAAEQQALITALQQRLADDAKDLLSLIILTQNPHLTESAEILLAGALGITADHELHSILKQNALLLALTLSAAEQQALITALQQQLADDAKDLLSLRILAEYPNLAESVQVLLAKDSEIDVQKALAQNPNLTESVQVLMAEAEVADSSVRSHLAKNLNLTESVQVLLAKDSEKSVRRNLAKNPNLTESVHVILLAKDSEKISSVCWAATTRDSGRWFS